jgi:hypothetical protein
MVAGSAPTAPETRGREGSMQRRVSYFDVDWSRKEGSGSVRLAFDDRTFAELRGLSMEEMGLIINMLRAEKPLYYDDETERLTTLR